MSSFIIGMAGHIDHGKTSLVYALTGVDTDTHKEEKERGITIDIGFAHWERGITFIDVPGHERFIHNMTAGVHAIDYALLVIAADDGIMPQTREHLDILRWLGIRQGAVVITKTDLVSEAVTDEVRRAAQRLTQGVFPDGHPVFSVSVKNGHGIEGLKNFLLSLPETRNNNASPQVFRMFVDRVFVKPGFGTVVTGTVRSGEIRLQSEVQVYPDSVGARVRGIQKRFHDDSSASEGERVAINLSFNRSVEIRRGSVLTEPGNYQIHNRFYAHVTLARPIKPHTALRLLTGTAELFARVIPISGMAWPDQSGFVWIRIDLPLPLAPGDRFILREKNASGSVGGGIIAWPEDPELAPLPAQSKHIFFQAAIANDYSGIIKIWLEAIGYFHIDHLARILGVRPEYLAASAGSGSVQRAGNDQRWYIQQKWFDALQEKILAWIEYYHRQHSSEKGMSLTALHQRFSDPLPLPLLEAALEALRKDRIDQTGDRIYLRGYKAQTDPREEELIHYIEQQLKKNFFQPPGVQELAEQSGYAEKEILRTLQKMIRDGRVIHTGNQLFFHPEAVNQALSILVDFLKNNPHITIQDFKKLTGTSRKYALALLEYFDRLGKTRRDGDFRILNDYIGNPEREQISGKSDV